MSKRWPSVNAGEFVEMDGWSIKGLGGWDTRWAVNLEV